MTVAFAHALGPAVRVNCIMPGGFRTDVTKAWDWDAFHESAKGFALRRIGEPHEMVGTALYLAGDASGLAIQSRGEEQRLTVLRAGRDDPVNRGPEAHVEHPIGLVEHDDFQIAQVERPAPQMVDHAAGRADGDIDSLFELFNLRPQRLAAGERHDVQPPAMRKLDGLL